MAVLVNYEVYIFDKRGWTIYSRYPSNERDSAINEAKSLEEQLNVPSKVVKESYDPKTSESREVVVYLSEKLAKVKKNLDRKKQLKNKPQNTTWLDICERDEARNKNKNKETNVRYHSIGYTSLIMRLFALFFSCIISSAILSFIIGFILNGLALGWSSKTISTVVFASFIIFFFVSSIISATLFVPWHKVKSGGSSSVQKISRLGKVSYPLFDSDPISNVFSFLKLAFTGKDDENYKDIAKEEDTISLEMIKQIIDGTYKNEHKKEFKNLEAEYEKNKKQEPLSYNEQKDKEEKNPIKENIKLDEIRVLISSFIDNLISIARSYNIKIDICTRVGLNLITAGATERLISFYALSENTGKKILKYAIAYVAKVSFVSASPKDRAFYDAFNAPKLESYHQRLIVLGNKAMNSILRKSDRNVFDKVGEELLNWRAEVEPKILLREEEEKLANTAVLMFTDIINSTAIATKKGETFAQKVLRANNTITREAVRVHQGREVKNLGDGFFLAFSSPLEAVLAAIDIQEGINLYNYNHPEEQFSVRIGLNSGEVIEEDGDLFGSAVNIASRISSEAKKDEIFVSENIYLQTKNTNIAFIDRGLFSLKGIEEKQHIYAVDWRNIPETKGINERKNPFKKREENEQEELAGGDTESGKEKKLLDDFKMFDKEEND